MEKILKILMVTISIPIIIFMSVILVGLVKIEQSIPFKNTEVYNYMGSSYAFVNNERIISNGNQFCIKSKDYVSIYKKDNTLKDKIFYKGIDSSDKFVKMTNKYLYIRDSKYNLENGDTEKIELDENYEINKMDAHNDTVFIECINEDTKEYQYLLIKDDGTKKNLNDYLKNKQSKDKINTTKLNQFTIIYSEDGTITGINSEDGWVSDVFIKNSSDDDDNEIFYFSYNQKIYGYKCATSLEKSEINSDNYTYKDIKDVNSGNDIHDIYNLQFYNGKLYGVRKASERIRSTTFFQKDYYLAEINVDKKESSIIYEPEKDERIICFSPEKNEVFTYNKKELKKINLETNEVSKLGVIKRGFNKKLHFSTLNNKIYVISIDKNEEAELIAAYEI